MAGMLTTIHEREMPRPSVRSNAQKAQITERDLLLFSLLLDFRLMDATHIAVWLGAKTAGEKRSLQRRLKLLYDKPNAFIDRVERRHYFVEGGGREPIIYSLNEKGKKALIESDQKKYANISSRVKKSIKQNFISHTLFNVDVATHIKLASEKRKEWIYIPRGVFFDDMITSALANHPKRHDNNYYGWPVIDNDFEGTLVPDYISCIVNVNTENMFFLFTEVDNSTEPVERKQSKIKQSDVWKKFALYDRSAKGQLYKYFLGLESPFRILFITGSQQRMENMIAANKHPEIRRGSGWHKFLFTTRDTLNAQGFLDTPWRNGEDENVFYFRDLEL